MRSTARHVAGDCRAIAVPADKDLSPRLSERVVGALALKFEVGCSFLCLDDCDVPDDCHLELALDRRVAGVEIRLVEPARRRRPSPWR